MYIGRFAPSPTGKLHLGSLLTAIASYCDAKANDGEWLLRIEDLDPIREQKNASKDIIQSLDSCGFKFKDPVFQSHKDRQKQYKKHLQILLDLGKAYYCTCSRKQLIEQKHEEHLCRKNHKKPIAEHSIKFKVTPTSHRFNDQIQGPQNLNLNEWDDFVLYRKEGFYSYQLAVVVDDHLQNVTDIVRGIDLVDSTKFQLSLIHELNLNPFNYSHLPILVNHQEQKLSKQTFAKEIDQKNPLSEMLKAYSFLGQKPFDTPPNNTNEFWEHAIYHWSINKVPKNKSFQV